MWKHTYTKNAITYISKDPLIKEKIKEMAVLKNLKHKTTLCGKITE